MAASPPTEPRGGVLRTAARALAVLDALARCPDGATPKALSAELDLHLSTVYHLLATLRAAGYAVQDPESRLFRLGARVPWLNDQFVASLRVSPALPPFLAALRETTGETVTLNRWWGDAVITVAVAEGSRDGHLSGVYVGSATPPLLTAAGRVLLAWATGRRREACLSRAIRDGADRAAVEVELGRIREAGYALDLRSAPAYCCVAAPVLGENGVAEALAVIAPRRRFKRERAAHVAAALAIARAASAIATTSPQGWPVAERGAPGTRREDLAPVVDRVLSALSG